MKQRQLLRPELAQFQKVDLAPDVLVKQCRSGAVALTQTALASGYTQEVLAEKIGKAREVLSRACNGRGGLDIDVLCDLINESGSAFVLQYMAKRTGFLLSRDTLEERKRKLREEMEAIEREEMNSLEKCA